MNLLQRLTLIASLALVLASCGAAAEEGTATPAVAEAATSSPAETAPPAPVERTDFIVFIEEPEPLSVFANDSLICTTHSEVAEILERVEPPRVQLYGANDELLATQEVAGKGPVLDEVCTMHLKFLDIPVSESYRIVFSGADESGTPYEYEGAMEFDQVKFDEGYTQGYTFELG